MDAPDAEPWQIARAHADVMARLRDIIAELAPHLQRDEDRTVLMHHAQLSGADAARITNAVDRERVEKHQREALRALMAGRSTASNGA